MDGKSTSHARQSPGTRSGLGRLSKGLVDIIIIIIIIIPVAKGLFGTPVFEPIVISKHILGLKHVFENFFINSGL